MNTLILFSLTMLVIGIAYFSDGNPTIGSIYVSIAAVCICVARDEAELEYLRDEIKKIREVI